MKPKPRIHWARRLLRHVTYDLYEFEDLYETNLKGVFGIPKNSIFAVFEVAPDFLDTVVATCRTIRLWHQHHGPFECPWAWKAVPLTMPKEQLDLVAHFAVEALRTGAVGARPTDDQSPPEEASSTGLSNSQHGTLLVRGDPTQLGHAPPSPA